MPEKFVFKDPNEREMKLTEIVNNVFGSWENLEGIIKKALADIGEDVSKQKPELRGLTRQIIGPETSGKLSQQEFIECMKAVNIVINKIKNSSKYDQKGYTDAEIENELSNIKLGDFKDDLKKSEYRHKKVLGDDYE